jgi:hypothetical protein
LLKGRRARGPGKTFWRVSVAVQRSGRIDVGAGRRELAWHTGDMPAEHAIRGVHGVTLLLEDASPTAAVLADVLGFNKVGQEEALIRFRAGEQIIPDALQKAKKWATLVEVAGSSSLNYRGAAVSAKHPGCGSGRVCLIVAISQSEVL